VVVDIDKVLPARLQRPTMIEQLRTRPLLAGALSSLLLAGASGCNLNKLVADQTGSVLHEAAPALDAFWDYDLAGLGIPGAIMQLEAFYSISPNNEDLALTLAKAYVGYANGWVENAYEDADAKGNMDEADRLRQRARLLHLRARNLALHIMRVKHKGIDDALKSSDPEELPRYLKKHYKSKSDVGPVFWAGLAWGAAINVSLDQPDLIVELPLAKALVTHALELDDLYFNGGAYMFLGAAEASLPAAMGGNPEKGREYFERGLERTDRANHMLQFMYARTYAVNTQNRELFEKLLNEIIDAPDLGPKVRLSNKIARVRAARYLARIDELF
jgi:hypothetical protein